MNLYVCVCVCVCVCVQRNQTSRNWCYENFIHMLAMKQCDRHVAAVMRQFSFAFVLLLFVLFIYLFFYSLFFCSLIYSLPPVVCPQGADAAAEHNDPEPDPPQLH